MTPSLNLSNLSKQIKKVIEDLNIQVISRWAPILHQYISAANFKKICETGLLVPQVCNSLPIGGTGSIFINILVQLAMLPPMHWRNSVSCTNIYVETYAQKLKKY
jgi:hypothetical protein